MQEKRCTKCGRTKDVSEFYKKSRSYVSWCKDCMKELSKQRVLDGRDKASKERYNKKKNAQKAVMPKPPKPPKPNKPKPPKEPHAPKKRGRKPYTTILRKLCGEMVRNAKKRALFLDKEIDIDVDYVENLVLEFAKDNKCEITLAKDPFKPSIDRIDNSRGYTKDNIKICWLIENYCKNTFTEDDVIEFCKRKLKIHE